MVQKSLTFDECLKIPGNKICFNPLSINQPHRIVKHTHTILRQSVFDHCVGWHLRVKRILMSLCQYILHHLISYTT